MAAIDDPRRSAARGCRSPTRRTSTSSSTCSERSSAARSRPTSGGVPPGARHLRPAAGRRRQMLRVKIPQGILDRPTARRARRRRRAVLARLRAHHHAAEHPVPLRQAARRRAGDAPARRSRPDDARGVRQLGAQHHRLPLRRRRRPTKSFDVTPYAEALTRYLLRHPLSSSLPRKFKIAFEGCAEDHVATAINDIGWLRRARRADGRSAASASPSPAARRCCRASGRCSSSSCRPARCSTSPKRSSASSTARRLPAQAAQPDEVPGASRSAGTASARSSTVSSTEFAAEGGAPLPFDPEHPPVEERAGCAAAAPPSIDEIIARAASTRASRPGHRPRVRAALRRSRDEFATGGDQRASAEAGGLRRGHGRDAAARRSDRRRSCASSASSPLAYGDGTVRVTPDQNLVLPLGAARGCAALYRRLAAARARPRRTPAPSPTSPAARAPSRASWR